ncbi:VMAP-C domain-containing protein [Streptomyces bambusae]|uniref:Uncharacterized protein n=1 Tax=Streptomyces bambusae TaxID=1550616 RepID=A0ABS6ZFQ9_9ACTN|nr:hypothetical protein [Streptomyces bambusae]MBW5485465.1 hypothetical protein [Streptomyces bambusae]
MNEPRPPARKAQLRLVLVDELCRLDCVRDPGQRVLFGQSVGEYLELAVDLPGKDARGDMVSLVQIVLRSRSDDVDAGVEAAVEAFVYAVGLHEGSDTAGELRERVQAVWAPGPAAGLLLHGAFEDRDVKAARALVAGQPGLDRRGLRDRLAHELRLELPGHLTPVELFEHLLDLNAQADGLPPAVVMLEFLAVLAPRESDRRRMRDWCDGWANGAAAGAGAGDALRRRREGLAAAGSRDRGGTERGGERGAQGAVQRGAERSADGDSPRCLIIMVDPAPDGSPDIFVRHWVNRVSGDWAPVAGSLERATLRSLEAAVERAIRRGEEYWADADRDGEDLSPIHVEFVLPYTMLNHDVAGLGRNADAPDTVPIGLRYYVHLRSLERMRTRDPAQLRRWRMRWQTLRSSAAARPHPWTWTGTDDPDGNGDTDGTDGTDPVSAIGTVNGTAATDRSGAARATDRAADRAAGLRIWRNQLVADQLLTAVTLGAPAREGQGLEPLKAAIAEGIGVALWDRRDPSQRQQLGAPLDMLVAFPTAQLPGTIHRLRTKAETHQNGAQLPGRYVAFFYDDPFRLIDCEEVPA